MSVTHTSRFSSSVLFVFAAIAIFAFCVPIAGHAGDKPPYLTATAAEVQAQIIGLSRKLGETDGDTYYFKPAGAGTGTGQIFRVSNKDPTKFAGVGTIISNQYMISAAEKSGFFAVVTDTPPSAITGDTSVVPIGSARPASATPTPAPPTATADTSKGPPSGKASWGDGHIPVVHFNQDPHFHDDVVVWRKGHIEISRDGSKFADLGYTGGGYGEGAATKGAKMTMNEIVAGVSNGRKANVTSFGWEITTIKGGRNTSVDTAASMNGIYQKSPYGLEGESVAATELFKQQVDPTFTYPGYDKLRQAAGLEPHPNEPPPQ
jgi:hypothetical protein